MIIAGFRDAKSLKMVFLKEIFIKTEEMGRENILGQTGKAMKANGKMGWSMGQGSGNLGLGIPILDNGLMEKFKVLGLILHQPAKDTKDNLFNFWSTDLESKYFQMETNIKENMQKETHMEMANTLGKIILPLKGNSRTGSELEKA